MKKPLAEPEYINANTWRNLNNEMIRRFQAKYAGFLREFDMFIVGYASCFAMVFEPYGKPILMLNAVRYHVPFCQTRDIGMLHTFVRCIHRLSSQKRLTIVSNNRADAEFLQLHTGLTPTERLPSLCLYTNVRYTPKQQEQFLVYTSDHLVSHPRLVKRAKFEWTDLVQYKGIVHFPYEISTMSMYEHYSMGIPLFFPTKRFLRDLWETGKVSFTSASSYWNPPLEPADMTFWLDRADFYDEENMKYVYFFDSFEDLYNQIETFTDPSFAKRQEWIQAREEACLNTWKRLCPNQ